MNPLPYWLDIIKGSDALNEFKLMLIAAKVFLPPASAAYLSQDARQATLALLTNQRAMGDHTIAAGTARRVEKALELRGGSF